MYRLVNSLWVARAMHDFQEQCQVHRQQCQVDRCDNAFVVIFFKTMYNKTIISFGFCDIRNNQGLGYLLSG